MIGSRAISLVFLIRALEAEFQCPPAREIFPCECTNQPMVAVTCDGMSSLASVQAVLGHRFGASLLPRLQLTNLYSFSLPSHALGDLSPRKLYLRDSSLRTIDEDAFQGQSSLDLLVLAGNRLREVPTEALSCLTSLRTLSLAGNFLAHVRLGRLDTLSFLFLSDNRISTLEEDTFPVSLKTLSLSRNLLATFNGSLHHLDSLDELYARANRLSSVRGQLPEMIRSLYLDHNQLSEIPRDLERLQSLTTLSVSGNRLESMRGGGLSSLRFWNASHNYISEMDGRVSQKLGDLQVLDLSGNYLKSVCPALKHLRELRELRLSNNHLKRLDRPCFLSLKRLKTLDLSRNHLTSVDAFFQQPLPFLATLHLNHNELSSLPFGLRVAKNLTELDISNNRFSILKFQQLLAFRDFAEIRMGGNPWKCQDLLLDSLLQRSVIVEGYPEC